MAATRSGSAAPRADAIPQIPHTRPSLERLVRGIALGPPAHDDECLRLSSTCGFLNTDPNTHAFVLATAALTSIAFAISMMNVLAVVLSHILR